MARAFSGTNQAIYNANGVSNIDSATMTLACWVYAAAGNGVNDTIYMTGSDRSSGNSAAAFLHQSPAGAGWRLRFEYRWSSQTGYWDYETDLSLTTWYHVAATYDRGDTANDPIIYINGSAVVIAENATPSGSAKTGVDTVTCGENVAQSNDWAGQLAEMAFWSRILTAGEIAQLGADFSPAFVLNGLEAYWPLVRDLGERVQGAGLTDKSSTVASHPAVIMPAGLFVSHGAAAAAGIAWPAFSAADHSPAFGGLGVR